MAVNEIECSVYQRRKEKEVSGKNSWREPRVKI